MPCSMTRVHLFSRDFLHLLDRYMIRNLGAQISPVRFSHHGDDAMVIVFVLHLGFLVQIVS